MAMLSMELNRFLGKALLDPSMLQQILNGNRAAAMQDFGFAPSECQAILQSKAHSLADLSRELSVAFAKPETSDAETQVERVYQTLQLRERPITGQYQKIVQRALNALDAELIQAEAVRLRMAS
jgi:hypothetical protein